jgi:hypothetical protein
MDFNQETRKPGNQEGKAEKLRTTDYANGTDGEAGKTED